MTKLMANYGAAWHRYNEAREAFYAVIGKGAGNRKEVLTRKASLEAARQALHLARKAAKAAGVTVEELSRIEMAGRPCHALM